MKISINNAVNFRRELKKSEKSDYYNVLMEAKAKVANANQSELRTILIVPATAMPQNSKYNTGIGNITDTKAQEFFDFVKLYWGINEIQIMPMGRYHSHHNQYPIYSGTSMDVGVQAINLTDYLSENQIKQIVEANKYPNKVNFDNLLNFNSVTEKVLKEFYHNIPYNLQQEFEAYKQKVPEFLERKSLFCALREIYNTSNYKKWNDLDKQLFDESAVSITERDARIKQIKELKSKSMEFFIFKNFLAEKSLAKGKDILNKKGMNLLGDFLCGFSYDEVWAYPKAFIKNHVLDKWNLPALDKNSVDAEMLLREKVKTYAKKYDGFRVDASWTYVEPVVRNTDTGERYKIYNGTKFLDIIDDEILKNKGKNYDLKYIMHEFAANPQTEFNPYESSQLKPFVKNRVKLYTSDYLSDDWGSADSFLKRGWKPDSFIMGAATHDSKEIEPTGKQIGYLSKILNIPENQLRNAKEFLKAKFAEPLKNKYNMLYFMPALGLKSEKKIYDDWTVKIPEKFNSYYFESLAQGKGFNPMDALEKQFKAQGLDKLEPKLYRKIVKYKSILERKPSMISPNALIFGIITPAFIFLIYRLIACKKTAQQNSTI